MNTSAVALLTVAEAAEAAGVAPATIRQWTRRYPDRLRTVKDGRGRLLLAETDVLDLEHATRSTRRGRPRTAAA